MGHPKKATAKKPKYQVLGKEPAVQVSFRLLGREGISSQRVRSEPIPEDPVFDAEIERVIREAKERVLASKAHDDPHDRDRHGEGPYGKKSR